MRWWRIAQTASYVVLFSWYFFGATLFESFRMAAAAAGWRRHSYQYGCLYESDVIISYILNLYKCTFSCIYVWPDRNYSFNQKCRRSERKRISKWYYIYTRRSKLVHVNVFHFDRVFFFIIFFQSLLTCMSVKDPSQGESSQFQCVRCSLHIFLSRARSILVSKLNRLNFVSRAKRFGRALKM